MRAILWAMAALALAGCASEKTVLVRFAGEPSDALVTINDRYIGQLGRVQKRGVNLPPGEYRVTVEQTGYFPHDQLIVVDEEQPPPPVRVELTRIPD